MVVTSAGYGSLLEFQYWNFAKRTMPSRVSLFSLAPPFMQSLRWVQNPSIVCVPDFTSRVSPLLRLMVRRRTKIGCTHTTSMSFSWCTIGGMGYVWYLGRTNSG
eukprot:602372-Amphidinium_carterae.1